jgi:hypothetical protein
MNSDGTDKKVREKLVIGWRENVSLPELGIENLPAKIDTGARTSALHAVNCRIVRRDGRDLVEFAVSICNKTSSAIVAAPLIGEREIKNTSGLPERRLIIQTTLHLGSRHRLIEVSLADRERMGFELILGRSALRKLGTLVDPGRSFVLDRSTADSP